MHNQKLSSAMLPVTIHDYDPAEHTGAHVSAVIYASARQSGQWDPAVIHEFCLHVGEVLDELSSRKGLLQAGDKIIVDGISGNQQHETSIPLRASVFRNGSSVSGFVPGGVL